MPAGEKQGCCRLHLRCYKLRRSFAQGSRCWLGVGIVGCSARKTGCQAAIRQSLPLEVRIQLVAGKAVQGGSVADVSMDRTEADNSPSSAGAALAIERCHGPGWESTFLLGLPGASFVIVGRLTVSWNNERAVGQNCAYTNRQRDIYDSLALLSVK